jgi:prepilin signal peptidase PulO-like enzyme (type II secretory pathway)
VEIFTGLFFLLTYWNFGITSLAILIAITGCGMIVIFVKDMVNSIIPDEIVIPLILLWLVIIVILFIKQSIFHVNIEGFLSPTKLIIAGGIGAILPAILVLVSHEKWMGMGDLKLSLLIGFSVGYPRILISLFFAYIFGAIAGLILIAARKKTMKQQIPFGPFLVAGWIIGLFAGKLIINWYLNYGYI